MADDLEREWEELEPNRRKNPFPSLNQTEYELFLATVRHEARVGAEQAIRKHIDSLCIYHREETETLKTVVFGSREKNVVGLDQKVDNHEDTLQQLTDDIKWSKRLIYGAFVSGVVALLVALLQVVIIG